MYTLDVCLSPFTQTSWLAGKTCRQFQGEIYPQSPILCSQEFRYKPHSHRTECMAGKSMQIISIQLARCSQSKGMWTKERNTPSSRKPWGTLPQRQPLPPWSTPPLASCRIPPEPTPGWFSVSVRLEDQTCPRVWSSGVTHRFWVVS